MKRIFLATDIKADAEFIRHFADIQHKLPAKDIRIKWVDPLHMHITLRFFGDTGDDEINLISKAVLRATASFRSFDAGFASLGVFRSLAKPYVIWAGCERPDDLRNLKYLIDEELAKEGFPPDKGDYSPHLTLGRIREVRNNTSLAEAVKSYRDIFFLLQNVRSVILYESKLSPAGPDYTALQEFILQ